MVTGELFTSLMPLQQLKPNIVEIQSAVGSTHSVVSRSDIMIARKALGDVLMLFPALEMWWKRRDEPMITLATDDWLMPLAQRQEFLSHVIDYNTVKESNAKDDYKEVYWLEGQVDFLKPKQRKHRTLLFADLLFRQWSQYIDRKYSYNMKEINLSNYFHLTEIDLESGSTLLTDNGWDQKKPLIALAPFTKSKLRHWGQEMRLVEQLPDYNFVLLHDNPTNLIGQFANIINLTGKTNIIEMAGVLKACSAAVVPDGGVMHAAGVLHVPTISIFGRVIPSKNRVAYYKNMIAKESNCPLTKNYCYDTQWDADCKHTPHYRACMNVIPVDSIIESLNQLLQP